MSAKTKAHCTIYLDDVRAAGSVAKAIEAWAASTEHTSSGSIGDAWGNVDENDFARRAMEGGALHYIDSHDGRMCSAVAEEKPADPHAAGIYADMGGGWFSMGGWSDESEVCIDCPDADEALEHPETVAMMAQAVIDYHGPMSDRQAWGNLVRSIQAAGDALRKIDADDIAAPDDE